MPQNKIGNLRTGQGLRRIQGQRLGNWRDGAAKYNYEIGELEPGRNEMDRPSHHAEYSRKKG